MTVTIDRHIRPRAVTQETVELLEETMIESIEREERAPAALPFAFDEASSLVCAHLDSDVPAMAIETWEAVVTAMQTGSALFASTTTVGGAAQCHPETATIAPRGMLQFILYPCLAYDADFDLGVESDYLPRYLLNRAWLGQFET